jgi:hypothetical protein
VRSYTGFSTDASASGNLTMNLGSLEEQESLRQAARDDLGEPFREISTDPPGK